MNSKILFEAAREGKVEVLDRLLQENRPISAEIRLTSLEESLLHVATKSEQLSFVNELMKIDPGIAWEQNRDGFRPLDIAVIMGNLAMVEKLLSFDRDLGRLAGKDNRTALHYAAVKGRVDIIDKLLSTCPDCIEDITVHGETALHLAVKNHQFDAFAELVKWLEKLSKESIINTQERDGNNVLHLVVSNKQYAWLNLLLDENSSIRGKIELNVGNGEGLTALDISDIVIQDSYDARVRELLQRGGAVRTHDSATITAQHSSQPKTNPQPIQHPDHHLQSKPASWSWYDYFHFQMERDSPGETRNAILVVAALIATVTFQAALTPPQGLFDKTGSVSCTFLFFISLGFMASNSIMYYLTLGFPLYMELSVSLISMFLTYCFAVTITGRKAAVESIVFRTAYTLLSVAFSLAVILRLLHRLWSQWRRMSAINAPTA